MRSRNGGSKGKGAKKQSPPPKGVLWEELVELIKSKKYQSSFQKINPETLRYVLEENNHQRVIQALVKALKKTDPQNATAEYAEEIIEAMRRVAETLLEK